MYGYPPPCLLSAGLRLSTFWAISVAMAKKRGKRRGQLIVGNVDEQIALGTLANLTGLANTFDETVNGRSKVMSMDWSATMSGLTEGEGPIILYLAHSDYTLAEVEEYIESTGTWNLGSKVDQEVAKRLIRVLGTFSGQASEQLNDGVKRRIKMNWWLEQGQTL